MPANFSRRVDYDRIAHLYDEPERDHTIDKNLIDFISGSPDLCAREVRILDMGCGTGKQLCADRPHFPAALMVGLDLFQGMLRIAISRCNQVDWVQGDSALPPFRRNSFHYITNQFSYSHVWDQPGMIAETYRLLEPGGRFAMTHIDPWAMGGWILYRCFQAARERDLQDFLPLDQFVSLLEEAGFINVQADRRYQRENIRLGDFLAYASQRHRTSQLMAIDDQDYASGIALIRGEMEKSGEEARVDTELCFVTVLADKPDR